MKHSHDKLVLGIMTPGGNAPGYNSFVKGAINMAKAHNNGGHTEQVQILGLKFGIRALLEKQEVLENLTALPHKTLESRFTGPGSELGNSRGFIDTAENNPSAMQVIMENVDFYRDRYNMSGLIVGGGDGSMLGLRNAEAAGGLPFNQVPITIDDDVKGTDTSVGIHSAAAELDRIVENQIADVSSHQRVILLQVMGRDAGNLALKGGRKADITLIGECPVSNEKIIERLNDVYREKHYAVGVVGENFVPEGYKAASVNIDPSGNASKGSPVTYLEKIVQEGMYESGRSIAQEDQFVRSLELGSAIRAVAPNPFDSRLARRMGADAVYLAISGHMGYMITKQGSEQKPVKIDEIQGGKLVDPIEYDFHLLQKNLVSSGVRSFVQRK